LCWRRRNEGRNQGELGGSQSLGLKRALIP
jgi:hypothetical protein